MRYVGQHIRWLLCFCVTGGFLCSELALSQVAERDWVGPEVIEPNARVQIESADLKPASCPLNLYGRNEPAMTSPLARVDDFGAKGDGNTDDSDAINQAIASLKSGGTVVLTSGKTYARRKALVLDKPNVRMWGYGATLYSIVTHDDIIAGKGVAKLGIELRAPGTALYGLTIVSNLRTRLVGHPNNSGVQVTGAKQEVVDTRIEYTGAGIFVRTGTEFFVARNVIYRTTADGIHVTTGSSKGEIVCNVVRETGDDMIAVVNYGRGAPTVGNVLIEKNDVSGQYWGRGITVVGGRDITIRQNHVSRATHGAGILITSEASYQTANVDNVLVEGNDIANVQTTDPVHNPRRKSRPIGQGGIEVAAPEGYEVNRILLRDNSISQINADGIRVRGSACWIGLEDNRIREAKGQPIRIVTNAGAGCPIGCKGNAYDGREVAVPQCGSEVPAVTGAAR